MTNLEPCMHIFFISKNSKTCFQRPRKNRQNEEFNDKLELNKGRKYCRMLPFCNILDLHYSIIDLEKKWSSF